MSRVPRPSDLEPLKAWRVSCDGYGDDGVTVVTKYAATRSKARMAVARDIQDAFGDTPIRDILPSLSVTRAPDLDEPLRVLDPAMTDAIRECMGHTLGNWRGRPETRPYRNYYCAATDEIAPTSTLGVALAKGWMRQTHRINDGKNPMLSVTPEGYRALGLPFAEVER